jgi:small subunit ribosomal protein S4
LDIALSPKAAKYMERRPYPPGVHGPKKTRRRKASDYKLQLMEKQRLRFQYNISEKQLRNYVRKAVKKSGNAADNLSRMLETRLDAMVFRGGFVPTMPAARQAVSHGHIRLNDRCVTFPSHAVQTGDVVSVKPSSLEIPLFARAAEEMVAQPLTPYLERLEEGMGVRLTVPPTREEVRVLCEFPKVIEFYAR